MYLFLGWVPVRDYELLEFGDVGAEVAVVEGWQILAFLLDVVVDALEGVVVN